MREALKAIGLGQLLDLLNGGSARHGPQSALAKSRLSAMRAMSCATTSADRAPSTMAQRCGSACAMARNLHAKDHERRGPVAQRHRRLAPWLRARAAAAPLEPKNRIEIDDERQIRRRILYDHRFEVMENGQRHAPRMALIDARAVGEAVANDPSPGRDGRPDDAVEMIGARSIEGERLRKLRMRIGSGSSKRRRRRSANGVPPGSRVRMTSWAERANALCEAFRLGAFPGSLAAFEGDEFSACHGADTSPGVALWQTFVGLLAGYALRPSSARLTRPTVSRSSSHTRAAHRCLAT